MKSSKAILLLHIFVESEQEDRGGGGKGGRASQRGSYITYDIQKRYNNFAKKAVEYQKLLTEGFIVAL